MLLATSSYTLLDFCCWARKCHGGPPLPTVGIHATASAAPSHLDCTKTNRAECKEDLATGFAVLDWWCSGLGILGSNYRFNPRIGRLLGMRLSARCCLDCPRPRDFMAWRRQALPKNLPIRDPRSGVKSWPKPPKRPKPSSSCMLLGSRMVGTWTSPRIAAPALYLGWQINLTNVAKLS